MLLGCLHSWRQQEVWKLQLLYRHQMAVQLAVQKVVKLALQLAVQKAVQLAAVQLVPLVLQPMVLSGLLLLTPTESGAPST
jgi:hypothetical protein